MLKFDGKVALVTGSGRGLGRSHALLLASRGAAVVVNDIEEDGANPANDVVAEILAGGGRAVANSDDITTSPEGVVRTAIDEFGQLDIVVNNAGINRVSPFGADAMAEIRRHLEVNFLGTAGITAAAWPHLVASGHGRVVCTASPTVMGFEEQTAYVASKGAVLAFARTLAIEGEAVGIRVNAIAPTAGTRMALDAEIPDELKQLLQEKMPPSKVSPVVAYLAHEQCAITGETIITQGGDVQRLSFGVNTGFSDFDLTPELVQEHLETILDRDTNNPYTRLGSDDGGASLYSLFS